MELSDLIPKLVEYSALSLAGVTGTAVALKELSYDNFLTRDLIETMRDFHLLAYHIGRKLEKNNPLNHYPLRHLSDFSLSPLRKPKREENSSFIQLYREW